MMQVYHEKQSKRLCGMHSVNNLLQEKAYDQKGMDNLCQKLTNSKFFNPHKGIGGYYDINVIEEALLRKNYAIKWHDRRCQIAESTKLSEDDGEVVWQNNLLRGLLVNFTYKQFFWFTKHHWFAILKQNENRYIELDSKRESKQYSLEDLIMRLNNIIKDGGHVLYVFRKEEMNQ